MVGALTGAGKPAGGSAQMRAAGTTTGSAAILGEAHSPTASGALGSPVGVQALPDAVESLQQREPAASGAVRWTPEGVRLAEPCWRVEEEPRAVHKQ